MLGRRFCFQILIMRRQYAAQSIYHLDICNRSGRLSYEQVYG
jgi:hypothetical protein